MPHVVVAAPPTVSSASDLAMLPACADIVELRLDLLGLGEDAEELERWIEASPRPVMATVRSHREGGAFTGRPADAARQLMRAAAAGAAYLDVETPVAPHLGDLPSSVELVASRHGPGGGALPREVGGRPVRYRKLARSVDRAADLSALRAQAEAGAADEHLSLVPYGALGAWRSAFVRSGSLLYGSAGIDAEVVAGQPSLAELLDELRAGEVTPTADLYGLLGRPPSRSPSPALHNAVFRAHDRNALYVPLGDLGVEEALGLPFRGFSVTTPYKRDALARADAADETALRVRAANTLVRRKQGDWFAANTDVGAIAGAVPDADADAGAFVYGAGGYAQAAVVALAAKGYDVRLGARHAGRGRAEAGRLDVPWAGTHYAREEGDRVLVNATPAGADTCEPSFVAGTSLSGLTLLDAPYRRDGRPTGLLEAGTRDGARVAVDGLRLLAAQAVAQAELFGDRPVAPLVVETAVRFLPPLLLLGLRGAGKSTVGRAVARSLGRPFLDLDEEVERITGKRPAWWIRMRGEASFRSVEADAAERVRGRRGVVVAAGGGVLEHPRARRVVEECTWPLLLEVSPQVAVDRAMSCTHERPLLADADDPLTEARRLSERRRERWYAVANGVIDASGPVGEVANDVAEAWTSQRGSAGAIPKP